MCSTCPCINIACNNFNTHYFFAVNFSLHWELCIPYWVVILFSDPTPSQPPKGVFLTALFFPPSLPLKPKATKALSSVLWKRESGARFIEPSHSKHWIYLHQFSCAHAEVLVHYLVYIYYCIANQSFDLLTGYGMMESLWSMVHVHRPTPGQTQSSATEQIGARE